jgi:hypothetical protein
MINPQTLLGYVKVEPFCPFRLHLASGRTFDVRHPEMIKVLRNDVLIFKASSDMPELAAEWDTVSLLLIESISHLEAAVH